MNKKLVRGGYLVALHALALALLVRPDLPGRVAVAAGLRKPGDYPFIVEMRGTQARLDPTIPAGAVIFLGDSNTQSMPVQEIASHAVNYGIGWQRSDQLVASMGGYASLERAAAVVIMVGTNDILQGRRAGIDARYRAILTKVPAGVPVVLVGVPPLAAMDVRAEVAAAQRACVTDPRCAFLDAGAVVTSGMLLTDGVHLSAAGYAALVPVVRQALQPLVAHHRFATPSAVNRADSRA